MAEGLESEASVKPSRSGLHVCEGAVDIRFRTSKPEFEPAIGEQGRELPVFETAAER